MPPICRLPKVNYTSRRTQWHYKAAKPTTQTSNFRMSSAAAPSINSRFRSPLPDKSRRHPELKFKTRPHVGRIADSSEMLRVAMLRVLLQETLLVQMTVARTSRISSSRAARRAAITMLARCLSHRPSTASPAQTTTIVTIV